jgi:hypothetical protein
VQNFSLRPISIAKKPSANLIIQRHTGIIATPSQCSYLFGFKKHHGQNRLQSRVVGPGRCIRPLAPYIPLLPPTALSPQITNLRIPPFSPTAPTPSPIAFNYPSRQRLLHRNHSHRLLTINCLFLILRL